MAEPCNVLSEGVAVKAVADGSGRNQAHSLAEDERVCEYRFCDESLAGRKPTCRFCTAAHKAAEHRLEREDRIRAELTVRTAPTALRRATRDGLGVRIYVTPLEAARWSEGIVVGSIRRKLDAAASRLGEAA